MSENALVALGSNARSRHGSPKETLEKAVIALDAGPVRVLRKSRFFRTPFFPPGTEPDVINAVVLVETALEPDALLARLHRIEAEFDRTRGTRWTSRTLDLDLVAMGARVLPDAATLRHWMTLPLSQQQRNAPDTLVLPHPRLQERPFVLVPAEDVAADWRHPLIGKTIRDMCRELPDDARAEVRPLT